MKAVIFDYNGVLVDDLALHQEAYWRMAQRQNSGVTKKEIKNIVGTTSSLKTLEFVTRIHDPGTLEKLLKEKGAIYIELAKKTDILFTETRTVIPRLAETHALAIATNLSHDQLNGAFPPELLEKFLAVTYEDVPNPKPAPDMILYALEKLAVAPEHACYVGDAIGDMTAAKTAHVLAIGITTGKHSRQQLKDAGADVVIGSLEELEDVLKC